MFQNTNHSHIGLIILITGIMLTTSGQRIFAASTGANFAQATLARANALADHYSGASNADQRDNALPGLRKETSEHVSHLSEADRVDYAEYMADVMSKTSDLSDLALMFISAGTSEQELMDGSCRLLSSNDPVVRSTGENLITPSDVKLPNGEMGQDIAVFNLALHDPKVPQNQLIDALFKLAPVESAQWFADHANLPADERAGLESDLQKAWKLHRALNEPNADEDTKAMLDDSVKNPLLDRWLHNPSWILRATANGLLQKRTELQTSDLQKAMQPVQVPKGLQISSN